MVDAHTAARGERGKVSKGRRGVRLAKDVGGQGRSWKNGKGSEESPYVGAVSGRKMLTVAAQLRVEGIGGARDGKVRLG